MLSFINSKKKSFTLIFFLFFLIIGLLIFQDYGISIDEDNTRFNGFVTLKYLFEIFAPEQVDKLDQVISVSTVEIYSNQTIEESGGAQGLGVIFDLPMAFIELYYKVTDSREYYLLRHFFNYLIFFVSIYFFFLIGKKRYDSYVIGLLGSIFLILSPRIFADSFYNNKDLVFMSFFIISLYTGLSFLNNPNLKNVIFFSIASALAINIRILGIILPFLVFLFFFIYLLRKDKFDKSLVRNLISLIFFLPLFTILFWPFLWQDPLENFVKVFQSYSNYDFTTYTFYLGEHINAKYLPWHYPLVWLSISTPVLYLILFSFGFVAIFYRVIKRLLKIEKNDSYIDLWRGNKELQDMIFFLTFIIPLFLVISFNSTLYDGWRHLYFIYPSFIMISLYGINMIKILLFKKKDKLLLIGLILFTIPTVFWMHKNHPHQNLYFNILAGKNFNKNFDMDYWGVTNHAALMHIIKNEKGKVNVSNIGTTDLHLSKNFLDKKVRNKISIKDGLENSDYIITNYRDWHGKIYNYKSEIPANFKPFYDITVDGVAVNTIYKKIK